MSALTEFLQKTGRLPPVALLIYPLESSRPPIRLTTFLNYGFNSSVVIPVDSFSFSFKTAELGLEKPFTSYVRGGDIAALEANGKVIMTGIIDVVDIETTEQAGELVNIHGRDLMGQLEDQTAVNDRSEQIWANQASISQAAGLLTKGTRIKGVALQDAPSSKYLLATEPGESRLTSLQRFLEPLNCIAWMTPEGRIRIGRPNMAASTPSRGTLIMDAQQRLSNVISMKAIRASTQIPNLIVPIWSGQESVVARVTKSQGVFNQATEPNYLRQHGHFVTRAVVVGTPRGSDPQSLSDVNNYVVARAAGSNLLYAQAKRELARANLGELIVQAIAPGHYNDDLEPFMPDQMYQIRYPRADVDLKMYLYQVEYTCSVDQGQRTNLLFCKLGTIVSDVRAR